MAVVDENRSRHGACLKRFCGLLNTGAQWHMLSQSYPNYKTVHRRFQTWCSNEGLRRVLTDVASLAPECPNEQIKKFCVARPTVRSSNHLDGSKNLQIGGVSDSIGLDGFGAQACGAKRGFSMSIIG